MYDICLTDSLYFVLYFRLSAAAGHLHSIPKAYCLKDMPEMSKKPVLPSQNNKGVKN